MLANKYHHPSCKKFATTKPVGKYCKNYCKDNESHIIIAPLNEKLVDFVRIESNNECEEDDSLSNIMWNRLEIFKISEEMNSKVYCASSINIDPKSISNRELRVTHGREATVQTSSESKQNRIRVLWLF